MEKLIAVKNEYNSLDTLYELIKKGTQYECSKDYDSWDVRTDANGQMEKCIVIKKSTMHGMKMYFQEDNTLKMSYIIPNKMMNAYFGKSNKRYRNVLEIVTGKVKESLLKGSQEKAFTELEQLVSKIAS